MQTEETPATEEVVEQPETIRVRWIGHKRRYYHVTDRDGYGLYRDAPINKVPVLDFDRVWETIREIPMIELTERYLLPSDPGLAGLSRGYKFGPDEGTFTQRMPVADWELIQRVWIGAVDGSGLPVPLPFAAVGDDDDGGRFATALQWRAGDPVFVEVAAEVERQDAEKAAAERANRS